MATNKQTRNVVRRLHYHWENLRKAMRDAEDLKVMVFERKEIPGQDDLNPYPVLFDLDYRIDKTTDKALAETLRSEIKRGIK